VSEYVRRYESASTDHAVFPLPEPSVVSQAAAINFDDLQHELNRLKSAIEGLQSMCTLLLLSSKVRIA